MASRLDINYMREIAQLRGGKCLSKNYIDVYEPLKWMCAKGHTWDTSYKIIQQGGWCVQCIKEEIKNERLENLNKIVEKKGGKCLSRIYINNSTKLKWQCKKKHIWLSRPNDIISGYWCPHCAHSIRLTIEEMQSIAKKRNGKCLSTKYINSKTKLKWQCKKQHVWNTTPQSIKAGKWCPVCSGKAKLTIEEMHLLAKQRNGKCLSSKYINSHSKLKWKCRNGHEWMATSNDVKEGHWCPYCSHRAKLTIEEMQSIAEKRKGKCLSSKYIGNRSKLKWKCDKKHTWMAIPSSIKKGRWCPVCGIEKRRKSLTLIKNK